MMRNTFRASSGPPIVILFVMSLMALPAIAQIGPGDAGNLFEIDGDVDNGGKEDWHDLIKSDGSVNGDPDSIMHVVDGTKGNDKSVVAKSDKVFHNPNTYNWKEGSVPGKDDLQNCNFYVFEDAGGDRRATGRQDRRPSL